MQLDLENENPNICKELEAGGSSKKIASVEEKPKFEEMRLIMKQVTEALEANFTDSENEFVTALKSMQKNILALKRKWVCFLTCIILGKSNIKLLLAENPHQSLCNHQRQFNVENSLLVHANVYKLEGLLKVLSFQKMVI